jgi:O-antigen/teichoic acid export membrane protein
MVRVWGKFKGDGLGARALRSSAATVGGYGVSQALRLGSNLILARLLFPEAFGIMALVSVLMIGLAMFSDVGITPAIMSSRRGDDPAFLDTAWTVQLGRGVILWLVTLAAAGPMAWFYDAPILAQLIPVAGLTLVIAGLNPTRIDTAGRHMAIGRVTFLDLCSQVVGVLVTVGLAWVTGSIWALVFGTLAGSLSMVALSWTFLPGHRNRPRIEKGALRELVHYGKWIFLSTIAGFAVLQSDKLIMGRLVTLDALGLYNIGFFLASFPMMLGAALIGRLMIPLYRESPPSASAENFARLRKVRLLISGTLVGLAAILALSGLWLVELLYDERYRMAGGVVVIVSLALLPQIIGLTYDHVALAQGDSRGFFWLSFVRAVLQVSLLLLAVTAFGVVGAAVATALSIGLSYPLTARLARKHGAWDGAHDTLMWVVAAAIAGITLTLHHGALIELFGL